MNGLLMEALAQERHRALTEAAEPYRRGDLRPARKRAELRAASRALPGRRMRTLAVPALLPAASFGAGWLLRGLV